LGRGGERVKGLEDVRQTERSPKGNKQLKLRSLTETLT